MLNCSTEHEFFKFIVVFIFFIDQKNCICFALDSVLCNNHIALSRENKVRIGLKWVIVSWRTFLVWIYVCVKYKLYAPKK